MRINMNKAKRALAIGCLLVAGYATAPRSAGASTMSLATGEGNLERMLGPTIPEFKAYNIVPPGTRHDLEPGESVGMLLVRLRAETEGLLSPLSGEDAMYVVKWGGSRLRIVHDRDASAIAFLSRSHASFALGYSDLDLVDPEFRIERLGHELVVHLIDPDGGVDARIIIDLTTLDLDDARVEIYEPAE